MVGVPRSKGCQACRKKKIACSQERPECLICQNAGRKCPGYRRDPKFVEFTKPVKTDPTASSESQQHDQPAKEQLTSKEFTFKNRFVSNFKHESKLESSTNIAVAIPREAPSSSTMLAVSQRNLVVGAHCRQLFGTILSHDDIHSWVEPRDHLLAAIAPMPNPSRALNISVLAFCTAKLSRIAKDPALAKDSSRLYGAGLRELQRALWDPKQMYKDDTLGACVLLALYEIYECPSGSRQGYKSHIDGCAMLMQKRGPEAHSTGLGHSVFSFFRVMAALESLSYKDSIFAQPKWKSVPFSSMPKAHFDRLVDLILETPAVLAWAETLLSIQDVEKRLSSATGLLHHCCELDAKLRKFYEELEASSSKSLYWTKPNNGSERSLPEHTDLFPERFMFHDIKIAETLMLYWSLRAILLSLICRIHGHLTGYGVSSATLPPVEQAYEFPKMARNVCQSVEFCFEDKKTFRGPMTAIAPLRMAFDTLGTWPGFEREVEWIRAALLRVQTHGLQIAPFLDQVPWGVS